MKRLFLTLVAAFAIACGSHNDQVAQILNLENRRAPCDSLLVFLNGQDVRTRARAVQALGKLQDPNCLTPLITSLHDAESQVRLEAAFALGQLGNSAAEDTLVAQLNREGEPEVKVRLVEALGKIGTEKAFAVLVDLFKSTVAELRAEAALSAGRLALRKLRDPSLTDALTRLLGDKSAEVRWKACYALMQIAHGLDSKSLNRAAQDEEAYVRMFAVQALGKLQNTAYLETLGNLLRRDPDWRVRVNAANALGNYPLRLAANYLTLLDANHHVRIAVIHALGRCALNEADQAGHSTREFNLVKSQLQEVLTAEEETESWTLPEKGAALVAYAQVMKAGAIDLISQFAKHPNKKLRARAMEALGETHSRKAFHILQNAYGQAPLVVKVAILEALAKIDDPRKPQLYTRALAEGDMVLTALSAEALSQDALRNAIQLPHIIDAFDKLPKPVDIESAQMIFDALARFQDPRVVPILETALRTPDKVYSQAAAKALHEITGKDYTSQIATFTQPHGDFTYKEIRRLKSAKAFIKTKRGTIQFDLLTDEAPLTVLNFVRLARQGFFDGLTFHRVVPNFVIQGGDPRGDSWGSPGYSIRSEFNKHPYLRGTVGMASAGKDTEGCQFFITHSPEPHLDGRYTVFGQVTAGLEVVDAIEEGDVMELVAVKR